MYIFIFFGLRILWKFLNLKKLNRFLRAMIVPNFHNMLNITLVVLYMIVKRVEAVRANIDTVLIELANVYYEEAF